MKILFATSEARPFTASGGLSDVAASLPKALKTRKQACRIITPLYGSIKDEYRDKMKYIGNLAVNVSWREQYCGIFQLNEGGIIYYFIDNEYYFKRDKLYGHYDDCERFAFFSPAVSEVLPLIGFTPDVIHCNDWQTALIPVYLELFYKNREEFSNIKTVFTIHNVQYQGMYGYDVLEDVLGIPYESSGIVDYNGKINIMKGAMDNCDKITTVSPTYAEELTNPWYAHGMDKLIRQHKYKVTGILNGIDHKQYDPSNASDIYAPFSAQDLIGKKINKNKLSYDMGLDVKENVPLMGIVSRLVSHKGFDLIQYVFDEIIYAGVSIAVLGTGEPEYEQFLLEMAARYPGKISVKIGFIPDLAKKIYAGSDMFLMPSRSEPCGLAQMISLRYGTIPIVRETGGLSDSIKDCSMGKGNGFTFKRYDAGEMLGAIHRALEVYNNSTDWENLVKYGMECNFKWNVSAGEYIKIYEEIIK